MCRRGTPREPEAGATEVMPAKTRGRAEASELPEAAGGAREGANPDDAVTGQPPGVLSSEPASVRCCGRAALANSRRWLLRKGESDVPLRWRWALLGSPGCGVLWGLQVQGCLCFSFLLFLFRLLEKFGGQGTLFLPILFYFFSLPSTLLLQGRRV